LIGLIKKDADRQNRNPNAKKARNEIAEKLAAILQFFHETGAEKLAENPYISSHA
jgi:hypothetical protein